MPSTQSQMPSKDALQRLLDGLQTLIREHLALARAEIKDDVRGMVRDMVVVAAGVPALGAGYLLLMIAIAYGIATWLPVWAAFAMVALLNLGAGAAVSYIGLRKVMANGMSMSRTGEELQKDKAWLASLKEGTRDGGEGRTPLVQTLPNH